MKYLSLFDGIGAACVAWNPLGWECVGKSEIDAFPIAVTKTRQPSSPHLGSVSDITEKQVASLGRVDLIVGGFPCQDLSVAGKRGGLRNDDGSLTRSGLFFDAMRVVRWARRHCGLRWLLIENVPGLYSSNGGRDFAAVVGEMAGADFGVPPSGWRNSGVAVGPDGLVEWATLDAQFFGLAQRRVRVFALADFGDWRSRQPVLLERASLRGDPAPSREAGQRVANALTDRADRGGTNSEGQRLIAQIAKCITTKEGNRYDAETTTLVAHSLRGEGFDASEDGTGRGTPLVPVAHAFDARQSNVIQYGDQSGPLDTHGSTVAVAIHENQRAELSLNDTVGAIKCAGGKPGQGYPAMMDGMRVRRLTPRECARLQGFPDDYLNIQFRGKPAADSPKYKALGNSMAVPVMAFIGRRIQMVDDILQERAA